MDTRFPRRLASAVCLALLAAACLPARADEAPAPPKATGKCMMWKVKSKTATVYLLGSMHLAAPEMYPLPREMEEAFAGSDELVVEVNINKLDQKKLMDLVQSKGLYGNNETLSGSIAKETWQEVKQEAEKLGLPAAALDRMKPWLVGLTLGTLEVQKMGLDPNLGIDKHFLDLAEKKGKPVEELESADFQINLLAGFDPKLQEQSLALTLSEVKNMKRDINSLKEAWEAGDAKAMNELVTKNEKEHPEAAEVQQKLIYDRNVTMTKKVEQYLEGDKTVFVVVGDAHLVGDKGIVKLLRDDKFTVEQSPATRPDKAEKPQDDKAETGKPDGEKKGPEKQESEK